MSMSLMCPYRFVYVSDARLLYPKKNGVASRLSARAAIDLSDWLRLSGVSPLPRGASSHALGVAVNACLVCCWRRCPLCAPVAFLFECVCQSVLPAPEWVERILLSPGDC